MKYLDILNDKINNINNNIFNKYEINKKIVEEKKENKDKKIMRKNNSMKQFNYNNKNETKEQRNGKALSPKKKLKKIHQTHNYFSRKDLKIVPESNNNINKKQRNTVNKNYGFKSKAKQEKELINGAIEHLRNNMLKNKNNKEISLELIQKKYNEINENNYEKKNRNNKRIKKEEESTMSFTSVSSELNQNKNNNLLNTVDSNNEKCSSNMFKKEMKKIMNYNKKIKKEKNCGSAIKNKMITYKNEKYEFNNDKNYNNKRMKKSLTQIKFGKTENENTTCSKNQKTNKMISPIENQKSIYYFNNSKNCSDSTKINNKNIDVKKFRNVLDKYVIYKNKKRKSTNQNIKRKEDNKINIDDNITKNLNKQKNKEELNKKRKNDSLNKNDSKIEKEIYNDIKFDKFEDDDRANTLCDDLGSNMNIKELINLPFYITPKYSNNLSQNNN